MALTEAQEQLEHELRVEQMQSNIEKMRFDIAQSNKQLVRQTWGIFLTAIGVVVAAFAAGAAWWNYFGQMHR